jgi:phenylpropionate dioxygenase-like ring-hydroxylating dioxygenase large terminal subunit
MRHEDQVEQTRKLLSYLDTRTTAMAGGVYRNNVTDYICRDQLERERETFFRRGALFVGLSGLLPKPGDYMAHDYAGVPMLLVRRRDGVAAAYLNVCRHRGARVAEGCGNARAFSCPYHSWTYGLDGRLMSRPDERSFSDVERATLGLRELPLVEKYGMIWVRPTPGEPIDVDAMLAGAERDMAAYGFAGWYHYETRTLVQRSNWKLVVDTFLETYHLSSLHPRTVSPILYTNLTTFDPFGLNLRLISPRRTIDQMRDQAEDDWNLIPYSAVIYILFPNTVFIVQGDHVETWHVFPSGDSPDESVMYISLYTPEPTTTDSAKRHWDRNFDLLMATVEKEDFPLSAGVQRGFHSGAQDHIVFGRNEPGLQHYHRSIKRALGLASAA